MMWKRRIFLDILPTVVAATLILYFSISREQSFLKTLPTLVTLAVQLLLVAANRYAFLVGGINSTIYGAAYFSERLYFSAASAILWSAPIQLITFFNWGRHKAEGHQASLKILSWRARCLVGAAVLGGFLICRFALAPCFAGAAYPTLDALCFTLGIVVAILSAMRYVESQYISAVSCMIALGMWICIAVESPMNYNYVVISVYSCFRITEAAVRWTGTYRRQKAKAAE